MNEEIQQIFERQLQVLPSEVVVFLSSAEWIHAVNEIGSLYNLSSDQLYTLRQEVSLVLAGLTHPDEFSSEIEQEAGIHGAVLDALVRSIEQKIFTQVRPALVKFFEKESAEEVPPVPTAPIVPNVPPVPPVSLDVAPDNLPTGETESFLPNLAPKTVAETEEPTHPFEEKMKRVFTAGQQSMGDLTIEPAPQATVAQAPKTPPVSRTADPYREPIE